MMMNLSEKKRDKPQQQNILIFEEQKKVQYIAKQIFY